MTRNPANSSGQPTIDELMVRFLANGSDIVESGEFVPHEVAAGFRVDPRAAWNDAINWTTPRGSSPDSPVVPIPNDWATLVNQLNNRYAVAMAAGNFPQLVRDVHPLLTRLAPEQLRPSTQQAPLPGLTGLRKWIARQAKVHPIQAGGLARLIGDFQTAEQLIPVEAANERAALLWHRGECDAALAAWQALPAAPEVRFNRGMAYLFLGRYPEARAELQQATQLMAADSGWYALAQLYLAVAEINHV
jgi:hypothetical protein